MQETAYETSRLIREMDNDELDRAIASLRMDERIRILASGLQRLVEFDSFDYQSPAEGVFVTFGKPGRHCCHYHISEDGRESAKLTLSRSEPFTEQELVVIESAMASIVSESHL